MATYTEVHFTTDQVLEALETVVKGREDYIDPRARSIGQTCKYTIDGAPSCIVGEALHRLGVPIDVLREMDCTFDPMFGEDGKRLLENKGYTFEDAAEQVLIAAQSEQDSGHTWGNALHVAREVVAE